ncbi:hypothetical protein PLGE761_18065 [Pluralibacter gergoviae]|nr:MULTISPECIES: hypothetical protein [Enterobacterales]SUB70675.1 Uncharacterised protein [Pluralibacter gergoviae]
MQGDEPLQCSWILVTLQGSFPFSIGQVAVLSPIIETLMRPVLNTRSHIRFCCLFIPSFLQYFFKNRSKLINGSPEPEFFAATFNRYFIKMPDIARLGLASTKVLGYVRAKFLYPAVNSLIGNVDP